MNIGQDDDFTQENYCLHANKDQEGFITSCNDDRTVKDKNYTTYYIGNDKDVSFTVNNSYFLYAQIGLATTLIICISTIIWALRNKKKKKTN